MNPEYLYVPEIQQALPSDNSAEKHAPLQGGNKEVLHWGSNTFLNYAFGSVTFAQRVVNGCIIDKKFLK